MFFTYHIVILFGTHCQSELTAAFYRQGLLTEEGRSVNRSSDDTVRTGCLNGVLRFRPVSRCSAPHNSGSSHFGFQIYGEDMDSKIRSLEDACRTGR